MPSNSFLRGSPELAPAELHRRLVWLTVFRTVTTTLSLGAIALRLLSQAPRELSHTDTLSFVVVGFVYLVTLGHALLLRQGRAGRVAAALQVAGDLVIASALVTLTGGAESPFTFTYSLAVVGAAIVLGTRGALVAALLATALHGTLLGALYLGVLPSAVPPPPASRLVFLLATNLLALLLIAGLTGFLVRRLSVREADLRRLGDLQRQILASMPSGLLTCDAQARVTFVNPAGAAILAQEELQLRGVHAENVLPGLSHLARGPGRRELTVQSPEGQRILGLSLTDLEGEEGGLLVVFQDLTELRRLEAELRRADRLATLGALSAQLAHEIRNPLAAMRGSAQLLAQDPSSDPATRRLTDILVRESDRLSRLVEDYLRYARPPPPDRRQVALDTLVRETVEMLRSDPLARGVRLSVAVTPQRARADAGQLRQVLINLLRNGFQAAGPLGRVRVVLEGDAESVRIRVWDSAGDIPAENLPRLFEPFFTTREDGTGLGLSTANAIVQAHGGHLRVSSDPKEGTEFVVELPLSDEKRQSGT